MAYQRTISAASLFLCAAQARENWAFGSKMIRQWLTVGAVNLSTAQKLFLFSSLLRNIMHCRKHRRVKGKRSRQRVIIQLVSSIKKTQAQPGQNTGGPARIR